MKEKSDAINLMLAVMMCSLIISMFLWHYRSYTACEYIANAFLGVLGSAFATLWIFIYEYRVAKKKNLEELSHTIDLILQQLNCIANLNFIGKTATYFETFSEGQTYIIEKPAVEIAMMSPQERDFYIVCRVIDGYINIDFSLYEKVQNILSDTHFWIDSGIRNPYTEKVLSGGKILGRHRFNRWVKSLHFSVDRVLFMPLCEEFSEIIHYTSNDYKWFAKGIGGDSKEIFNSVLALEKRIKGTTYTFESPWFSCETGFICEMKKRLDLFNQTYSNYFSRVTRKKALKQFVALANEDKGNFVSFYKNVINTI